VTEVFSICGIERRAATSATRQSLLSQTLILLALAKIPDNQLKDIHIRPFQVTRYGCAERAEVLLVLTDFNSPSSRLE
jgi:hypothetical protein